MTKSKAQIEREKREYEERYRAAIARALADAPSHAEVADRVAPLLRALNAPIFRSASATPASDGSRAYPPARVQQSPAEAGISVAERPPSSGKWAGDRPAAPSSSGASTARPHAPRSSGASSVAAPVSRNKKNAPAAVVSGDDCGGAPKPAA